MSQRRQPQINLYYCEDGTRQFRGSYHNFRDVISAVIGRCKLRSSFQNSFIETDDLLELARLTDTKVGDFYRFK